MYRVLPDDFDPALFVVYLRQYFIEREERRKGYGRLVLQLLREERFGPETEEGPWIVSNWEWANPTLIRAGIIMSSYRNFSKLSSASVNKTGLAPPYLRLSHVDVNNDIDLCRY